MIVGDTFEDRYGTQYETFEEFLTDEIEFLEDELMLYDFLENANKVELRSKKESIRDRIEPASTRIKDPNLSQRIDQIQKYLSELDTISSNINQQVYDALIKQDYDQLEKLDPKPGDLSNWVEMLACTDLANKEMIRLLNFARKNQSQLQAGDPKKVEVLFNKYLEKMDDKCLGPDLTQEERSELKMKAKK
jgi:hypothetical protein